MNTDTPYDDGHNDGTSAPVTLGHCSEGDPFFFVEIYGAQVPKSVPKLTAPKNVKKQSSSPRQPHKKSSSSRQPQKKSSSSRQPHKKNNKAHQIRPLNLLGGASDLYYKIQGARFYNYTDNYYLIAAMDSSLYTTTIKQLPFEHDWENEEKRFWVSHEQAPRGHKLTK